MFEFYWQTALVLSFMPFISFLFYIGLTFFATFGEGGGWHILFNDWKWIFYMGFCLHGGMLLFAWLWPITFSVLILTLCFLRIREYGK